MGTSAGAAIAVGIDQWFSTGVIPAPPREYMQMSGKILGPHNWGQGRDR